MKITGTIDIHDRIAWINWYTDNPKRGPHPWWNRLFGPIALVLPPLLFYLLGDKFHWGTYGGVIICWALLFGFWRFLHLLVARRKAKQEDESYPFEVEQKEYTFCLSARGRTYDYPSDKVGAIRLKQNLVITMDEFPICITPRNENLHDGKTIDDIEKMIQETDEQPDGAVTQESAPSAAP